MADLQKELYESTEERWDDAVKNCKSLHEKAADGYSLYNSWEHKDYGYADNYDPAIAFRKIEDARAYLRCNVLEPGITAAREEDSEKAHAMNNIVKADYSTSEAQKSMDDYYLDMFIGGTGILKLGWSFYEESYWRWVRSDEELVQLASEAASSPAVRKVDPATVANLESILQAHDIEYLKKYLATGVVRNIVPEHGNTGFKVRDISQADRPKFEIVPIYDMAWLGSGSSIRECDAVFRRFYVTRDQVEAWKYRGGDWQNLDKILNAIDKKSGDTNSTSQELDIANGRSILPGRMIEFIEETRRDPITGELYETIINTTHNVVVRHRKLPYFHNQVPYFTIRLFGNISDFAGIPLLVPAESSIFQYIKVFNEILENGELAINKVFVTRIGAMQPAPQLHVYSGNLIAVDSYDDVRPLEIPDLRPSSLQLLQTLKNEIEEITGCPAMLNAMHGDSSGGNAGALEQLQFYQTARFAAAQHQIAVELSALTLQMVKLHQQYDYKGRTVYVEDKHRGGEWVYYAPDEFAGDFNANSDPRSMLPTNNAVKRAQLLSVFNLFAKAKVATLDPKTKQPVQELVVNPVELTKEVLSTFDMMVNKNLFNRRGEITAIDPDALPIAPVASQKQQEAAKANTDKGAISEEDQAALQQVADATGTPVEDIVEQGQQTLERSKEAANAPIEIQGGAQITPDLAQQINSRDFSGGIPGGGDGSNTNDTVTGTTGMPPVKGGTQQTGSRFDPNNLPTPATEADANQSGLTLQR